MGTMFCIYKKCLIRARSMIKQLLDLKSSSHPWLELVRNLLKCLNLSLLL